MMITIADWTSLSQATVERVHKVVVAGDTCHKWSHAVGQPEGNVAKCFPVGRAIARIEGPSLLHLYTEHKCSRIYIPISWQYCIQTLAWSWAHEWKTIVEYRSLLSFRRKVRNYSVDKFCQCHEREKNYVTLSLWRTFLKRYMMWVHSARNIIFKYRFDRRMCLRLGSWVP